MKRPFISKKQASLILSKTCPFFKLFSFLGPKFRGNVIYFSVITENQNFFNFRKDRDDFNAVKTFHKLVKNPKLFRKHFHN